MIGKTLVCSYGKDLPVDKVFEHLYANYLLCGASDFIYCALIDLPDANSYRRAGDGEIEEAAEKSLLHMQRECCGKFFCGIRQRRIGYENRRYTCENGAAGAIEALWRCVKGKNDSLFPIYGNPDLKGVQRVLFSCPVEVNGVRVIESGGVFKLISELGENDAVFVTAGAIEKGLNGGKGPFFDGFDTLYSASALDRMLFCEPYKIRPVLVSDVGFSVLDSAQLRLIGRTVK